MSVQLQSGRWKGTRQQLKAEVATAVFNGSFQGMLRAINKVQPDLAQRTGSFRRVFAQAALEHVQDQIGKTQIKISVDEIASKMISALNYARYHIDGKPHHPGDTSAYTDPSTSGTKPLDTDELKRVAGDEIRQSVIDNFRSAGLEFLING